MNQIAIGYANVGVVYQIALAAYELSELERFHCSVLDAPGLWGDWMSKALGPATMTSWRCPGLPASSVKEYPWPLFRHMFHERVWPRRPYDWFATNESFDRHVAAQLKNSGARLFIGAETCSQFAFTAAKARGMHTLLDGEQVHPAFLWSLLARAAEDLGLPAPRPVNTPEMAARKEAEHALADTILVFSEVERRSFVEQGFPTGRLAEIPLWADTRNWYPSPEPRPADSGKQAGLRAVFVGGIDLRKGIPYLLQAARQCGDAVRLLLVGRRDPQMEPVMTEHQNHFDYEPPKTKPELRELFWHSDVLVLPSLVDAFGFVAMEAMACGLPVIVTENCGVPVPDPTWRVPIMDGHAIAERLLLYAADRELCRADGELALNFARQYQPEVYRRKITGLFRNLLDGQPPAATLAT